MKTRLTRQWLPRFPGSTLLAAGALTTCVSLGACGGGSDTGGGSSQASGPDPAALLTLRAPALGIPKSLGRGPETMVFRPFYAANMPLPEQMQLITLRKTIDDRRLSLHQAIQNDAATLAELRKPTPDAARLHALVDEAMTTYGAIAHSAADGALALQGKLTTEQRADLVRSVHLATSLGDDAMEGRGIGGPDLMVLHFLQKVELDEDQRQSLTAVHEDLRARRVALASTIQRNEAALLDELGKPTPNRAAIHDWVTQAVVNYAQIAHRAVDRTLAIHSTLTVDQRDALSL
jgi:Spy/CpxP family protein refolding chaperone